MRKYFYSDGFKKWGPFSKEELTNQKINRKTKIWYYGLETWVEMNQIDGSLLFTISDLKKGQLSQTSTFTAEDGKKGFRIIMIKSESEAHIASLKDDYSKIQAAARQAKQQEALVKWIKEKKGDTYIMIDDDYSSCDNVQKWLKEKQ